MGLFLFCQLHESVRRAKVFEGERKEKEVNQAKEALQVLDDMLKGKKFFGGDSIGFLDIAFGWVVVWLQVYEEVGASKVFESDQYPFLDKWVQNFVSQQVIRETLPSKEELIPFFQRYRMAAIRSKL